MQKGTEGQSSARGEIRGRVTARLTGHRDNIAMVRLLAAESAA